MKTIQQAILILATLFVAHNTNAQGRGMVKLTIDYAVGIPMGSYKDFIDNTSWRGYTGDLLYGIDNKWAVGLTTGFQDYYKKYPRQLYKASDGSDVSAVVSNSVQTVPLMVKGKYTIVPGACFRPYVAVSVGGNIVYYRQFIGELEDTENEFDFSVTPEIGVNIVPRGLRGAGINIGAGYNYTAFHYSNLKNLDIIVVKAGINVPLR